MQCNSDPLISMSPVSSSWSLVDVTVTDLYIVTVTGSFDTRSTEYFTDPYIDPAMISRELANLVFSIHSQVKMHLVLFHGKEEEKRRKKSLGVH